MARWFFYEIRILAEGGAATLLSTKFLGGKFSANLRPGGDRFRRLGPLQFVFLRLTAIFLEVSPNRGLLRGQAWSFVG